MKKILFIVFLAFTIVHSNAQKINFDSLKRALEKKTSRRAVRRACPWTPKGRTRPRG